jgi:hypothetical protein
MLACALLTACAPEAQLPRPDGTREPSVTESSAEAQRFEPSDACKLLTSEEREELGGVTLDAEVPVRPIAGTQECIWTHSATEPARSAVRVVASIGQTWVRAAQPQILLAIAHPSTDKATVKKLKEALAELESETKLKDERICEIYLQLVESRGMTKAEDMRYAGSIGSMPAFFAASCNGGFLIMAGYGEYGLRGSIALNNAVGRLVKAANDRAPEVLGDGSAEGQEREDGTATEGDSADDEDASPEPSDSGDEDES